MNRTSQASAEQILKKNRSAHQFKDVLSVDGCHHTDPDFRMTKWWCDQKVG
jgi:hypothetical protein